MENIIATLIIISIVSAFLCFILKYIVIPIMEWRTRKLKHKIALQAIEFMELKYETHLKARHLYYRAKQIEDPLIRSATMSKYAFIYKDAVKEFNDSTNLKHVEFLTPDEKSKLDEVMSKPIYGLD